MRQRGFSIIEILVVVLIIGLLVAIVAPNVLGNMEEAKLKKAAIDIQKLETELEKYKLRTGMFPTTEQGLQALVEQPSIAPIPRSYPSGGFLKRLPDDPWGQPYQLLSPGEMSDVDIFSYGPDQVPGTDDDIGNWNMADYLN